LTTKFTELLRENKQLEKDLTGKNLKNEQLSKEKASLSLEVNKLGVAKSRLENLCRVLQEDNKRIVDDEQSKRQEIAKKFHDKIEEITTKMEEQGTERIKLYSENELLREKLKNFAEQYQIREKHFETQLKTKDLELQLLEAKVNQLTQIAAQEAVKAKSDIAAYKQQIASLTQTEEELRKQLALYAEKFEQFQETLTKSNDVFNTFKQEMDRMTKTIKKNEKENFELKKKCEQTDLTLIDLAEERNNYRKQLDVVTNQKKKLEDLCRILQSERAQTNKEQEKE